jgi:hypothetical protein
MALRQIRTALGQRLDGGDHLKVRTLVVLE